MKHIKASFYSANNPHLTGICSRALKDIVFMATTQGTANAKVISYSGIRETPSTTQPFGYTLDGIFMSLTRTVATTSPFKDIFAQKPTLFQKRYLERPGRNPEIPGALLHRDISNPARIGKK